MTFLFRKLDTKPLPMLCPHPTLFILLHLAWDGASYFGQNSSFEKSKAKFHIQTFEKSISLRKKSYYFELEMNIYFYIQYDHKRIANS